MKTKPNLNDGDLIALHNIWHRLPRWKRKLIRYWGELFFYTAQTLNWIYSCELYIFPPLIFIADYFWMSSFVPEHPIGQLTIITSAFMSATFSLFLIRPPKRIYPAHWVRE